MAALIPKLGIMLPRFLTRKGSYLPFIVIHKRYRDHKGIENYVAIFGADLAPPSDSEDPSFVDYYRVLPIVLGVATPRLAYDGGRAVGVFEIAKFEREFQPKEAYELAMRTEPAVVEVEQSGKKTTTVSVRPLKKRGMDIDTALGIILGQTTIVSLVFRAPVVVSVEGEPHAVAPFGHFLAYALRKRKVEEEMFKSAVLLEEFNMPLLASDLDSVTLADMKTSVRIRDLAAYMQQLEWYVSRKASETEYGMGGEEGGGP